MGEAAGLTTAWATKQKNAAFQDLNALIQGLVRNETWHQLDEHAATTVVSETYKRLSIRQAASRAGGAGGRRVRRSGTKRRDDAPGRTGRVEYRERFLIEKYGLEQLAPDWQPADTASPASESLVGPSTRLRPRSTRARSAPRRRLGKWRLSASTPTRRASTVRTVAGLRRGDAPSSRSTAW
jgi:hypothetical protein